MNYNIAREIQKMTSANSSHANGYAPCVRSKTELAAGSIIVRFGAVSYLNSFDPPKFDCLDFFSV